MRSCSILQAIGQRDDGARTLDKGLVDHVAVDQISPDATGIGVDSGRDDFSGPGDLVGVRHEYLVGGGDLARMDAALAGEAVAFRGDAFGAIAFAVLYRGEGAVVSGDARFGRREPNRQPDMGERV